MEMCRSFEITETLVTKDNLYTQFQYTQFQRNILLVRVTGPWGLQAMTRKLAKLPPRMNLVIKIGEIRAWP